MALARGAEGPCVLRSRPWSGDGTPPRPRALTAATVLLEGGGPGDAIAQSKLAAITPTSGVPQDYAAALNRYRKAAYQGDARAKFNLGSCTLFVFAKFADFQSSSGAWNRTRNAQEGMIPKPGCNRRSGTGDGGMMPAL